uniref:Nitrogenase iron protein n=1 Tax=Steinernema glaseri TaxID=37863 RepID=A0A1I7YQC8_9BILA
VLEPRRAERCAPGDVYQLGRTEAEQPVAIAEQAVEHALATELGAGLHQHRDQLLDLDRLGECLADAVEQVAEGGLAVGIAHWAVEGALPLEVAQLAVVCEAPVAPPQFAHERVGVGQAHLANVGLANVADDHLALDRITLHQ